MSLAQIFKNITSLSLEQFKKLNPKGQKSLLKKHQRKFFEIAEGLDAISLTEEDRAQLNGLFKSFGLRLWAREEKLIPAIQPQELLQTLNLLKQDEKLHFDSEHGVFRKRKVRNTNGLKIGKKSKEAYYAVLNEIKQSIVAQKPDVELYLALINGSWFKHYAKGDVEQAAIIALSVELLNALLAQCAVKDNFPYQKEERLLKALGLSSLTDNPNLYMLYLLKINGALKNEVFAKIRLSKKIELEKLLDKVDCNAALSGKTKKHFQSGNLYTFLKATGDTLQEEEQTKKYKSLTPRLKFGSKAIILDALGNFELVDADKANLIAKNKAYQLMIDECDEGINTFLEEAVYLLNGQHFLDYLQSLTASLRKAKEDKELFLTTKIAVEKMERFLAAMPFQDMTHQDQIIKGLQGFYEEYENALYDYYFKTFKAYFRNKQRSFIEFNVRDKTSTKFAENLIDEINSKGSLDEQIFFLEHLAKVGSTARKKARSPINHAILVNIYAVFENLNLKGKYLKRLSKRARKINRKVSEVPSLMVDKKTRFTPAERKSKHSLLSKIPTETRLQRLRRKHNKLIGYLVGWPLGLGAAALVTFAAVTLINPVIGFILGGACLIINCILYPDVVSSLSREGVFTVGDHTIAKSKYKKALGASFVSTTILALLLGIATAFAIVALSASTFGLFPAVALGVSVGLVTWLGNTFLNADVFRTVFAYFDKRGSSEGWKRIRTTISNFFSYKECRDWRDVVRKTVKILLQPLFIAIGLVLAVASSVAMIGVLRGSFLELLGRFTAFSATACEILANILVRGIGLFAELPLELKSAGELLNRWAKSIGNKVSSAIINTIDGVKFAFAHPLQALEIVKNSFSTMLKNIKTYFVKEIKLFNENRIGYLKKIGAAIWNGIKQVALILNAIGNGYFAQSGADENNILTGHINDKVVGNATTVSAGILSYGICKTSVDKHEEEQGDLALSPELLSSTKHSFFAHSAEKITDKHEEKKGNLALNLEHISEDELYEAQNKSEIRSDGYSALPTTP